MEQTEKIKFWREPQLEFLRATYFTQNFARHTHDEYAIGVVEHGADVFDCGHKRVAAVQGSIIALNPGQVHNGQAATEQGWSYRMFYPDPALLQQAASQLAGRHLDFPIFPDPVIQDPALARQLLDLHHFFEAGGQTSLERESRMLWTLTNLISRHAETRREIILPEHGSEARAVGLAREYLHSNYTEDVSLQELSELTNLSQFHLLRLFRREFGLPPHSYLTQLRLSRVKTLLGTGLPISQVAADTGFVDQSHLTRTFKRFLGVTPGQYLLTR